MRTIKFRVWDGKYNCYMQTDKWGISYVAAGGRGYSLHHAIINETLTDKIHEEIPFNGTNPRWTVEQFTGLKDKNEQEIYEGDVLQIPDEEMDGSIRKPYGHVWYSELSAEYIISYNHLYSEVSEQLWHREIDSFVVGNIHQNPEFIH